MKRIISFAFLLFPLLTFAFEPATITMTNLRAEAVSPASSEVYYRSEAVNFTNCVLYAGATTNSARQDLTGLTILLTYGDTTLSSLTVTGTATITTSGVWNASVTLRSNEGVKTYLQLRLTNSAGSFAYPFKTIEVKSKL